MAVGSTRGAGAHLEAVPPAEAREVRHFDQLDDREQHAFLQMYRGNEPTSVPLNAGEIVVFTEYFRVEL